MASRVFYGLSTSRRSITYYGILWHITPWAVTGLHVMIYYSMESHDMMLYGMMSHGIVWFSLAVQRGVACCSGWLYDESWVCGLDLSWLMRWVCSGVGLHVCICWIGIH